MIVNSGKAKYAWVTLLPLSFVGSTTLVAGWKSITDIFWPLTQKPETALQGYVNVACTANIMVAAVVILIDSIRGWLGLRNRPQPTMDAVESGATS
jgi:carbon starvation protein